MTQASTSLTSFMAESVPVARWYLYSLRFFFLFAWLFGSSDLLGNRFALQDCLASALGVTAVIFLSERYGDGFRLRHPWMTVALWFALLVVAIAIAWHGIEKHRQDQHMNSNYTVSHP